MGVNYEKAIRELKEEKLKNVIKEIVGTDDYKVVGKMIIDGDLELTKIEGKDKDVVHLYNKVTEEAKVIEISFNNKTLQVEIKVI